jgi:hypothetical protein
MKHFDLIGLIDIEPILEAIKKNEDVYNAVTIRQDIEGSPHKDTRAMYLRMPHPPFTADKFLNSLEVIDWPLMTEDAFSKVIRRIAFLTFQEPARAMIVELAPGGYIDPHIDQGIYAENTDRYHLCITTNDGCFCKIGDDEDDVETVFMKPGQLYWFDKHSLHRVANLGTAPRIHLIVDCWKD